MEYRTLGRTGLKVSVLGFGGAPAGIANYLGHENRDDPAFHERAIEAIRTAVARGITYFDTARAYGSGRSEEIYGRGLEGVRDRVVLATKFGLDTMAMTHEQRTEAMRVSLERLRTDHVDVLQVHGNFWDDETTDKLLASDLLDWASEMKASGLTRHVGITSEGPGGGIERLILTGRFDVLHIAFNFIFQVPYDYRKEPGGVIPMARKMGIGITTMRSATSGALHKLLHSEFPELDSKRITRLAINFAISTPLNDCAVVGMKTREEVLENVALVEDTSRRIDVLKIHDRFDGQTLG
jgi:uncharacterized protein